MIFPSNLTIFLRWKIFELDGCEGSGKACLVFPPKSEGAQVPIFENELDEVRFLFVNMSLRKYLLEKVDETGNLHMELIPPEPQVSLRKQIDGETVQLDFMLNTNS